MTVSEWAAIQGVRPDAPAPQAHADPRFVEYQGACPLLTEDRLCSVYTARPYNCRRFICLRPTASDTVTFGGPLGCYEAAAEVQSNREAMRFAQDGVM